MSWPARLGMPRDARGCHGMPWDGTGWYGMCGMARGDRDETVCVRSAAVRQCEKDRAEERCALCVDRVTYLSLSPAVAYSEYRVDPHDACPWVHNEPSPDPCRAVETSSGASEV